MTGWLDRLPTPVRHLLFSAGAILTLAGLNWLQANYTTLNLGPAIEGVIAILLPLVVAYVTPWTRQYGVGSGSVDAPVLVDPATDVPADPTAGTGV